MPGKPEKPIPGRGYAPNQITSPVPIEDASSSYMPMLHGKATDTMAEMVGRKFTENPITSTYSFKKGEVVLKFGNFKATSLSMSTHKMLCMGIAALTEVNHVGTGKRQLKELSVSFSEQEYALMCGYDVIEHETNTPEEAKKEAARAKNEHDNARKKFQRDLKALHDASISWEEKVRGKVENFEDVHILQRKGIRNGYINMKFTDDIGGYLINMPITQYPTALLKLDERNTNAYSLGLRISEHYSMDNNIRRGTADLLKVKTLLAYTDLPKIEDVRSKGKGWEERIKEPFEKALDAITRCGLLKDWEYTHSKGVPMTDEEAAPFPFYEAWADAYIKFTLANAPDHTARLEARDTDKEKAEKKRKRKPKAKKADDEQ